MEFMKFRALKTSYSLVIHNLPSKGQVLHLICLLML